MKQKRYDEASDALNEAVKYISKEDDEEIKELVRICENYHFERLSNEYNAFNVNLNLNCLAV